ncbi:MAG: hypothetical protein CVV24_12590 [Ignavibacteriae bacterium HGW-Ignavibacteriae-3]|nr:MAG: hypothetical protein CVV24_12590 [Ignavibacteriae bacterium HGW-Ignavibacteriae-3]
MKTRWFFLVAILSTLLFTGSTFADVNKDAPKANTYEAIEMNRLIGLASDNQGLRVSCTFNLGEMKSEKAVIPLMKLLREGETYEERVIAALSLIKIGNAQGVYLVSRLAKFCECDKTRRICEKFYNGYLYEKYKEEHPAASATLASK